MQMQNNNKTMLFKLITSHNLWSCWLSLQPHRSNSNNKSTSVNQKKKQSFCFYEIHAHQSILHAKIKRHRSLRQSSGKIKSQQRRENISLGSHIFHLFGKTNTLSSPRKMPQRNFLWICTMWISTEPIITSDGTAQQQKMRF